jgi:adenylate kinase family enzyme
VRRVSVVGNSGSGKSTLARRIATAIGAPYVELDAIHHLPGWEPIDRREFERKVEEATAGDTWVVDGNYRSMVAEGPVWRRADTVVWLDLPRRQVMRQVTARTLRRLLTREELWNGNREPLRNLYRWDPHRSIIRWAWTQHGKYEQRHSAAMIDPALAHLTWVRLRSHAEAAAWLASLSHD